MGPPLLGFELRGDVWPSLPPSQPTRKCILYTNVPLECGEGKGVCLGFPPTPKPQENMFCAQTYP